MIAVNLQFSPADVAAFRAQMDRLTGELLKEPKEAVCAGSLALLKALAVSTRRAPEFRKVRKERIMKISLRSGKSRLVATGAFVMDVRGKPVVIAESKTPLAMAKTAEMARIKYAGLAKASWGWAAKKLFNKGAGMSGVPNPHRSFLTASATGKGDDYTVTVENRLGYISHAFNSKRGPAVATAMSRAAATIKGRIDQRIKGAIK